MVIRSYVLAVVAVLPLLAPEVWSGFRVALSDPVLSVLAATEQPLSVRSPAGIWAMVLALSWFVVAYWRRDFAWWEAALVVVGGAAVLVRLGNGWIYAALMVVPLARQLAPLLENARFAGWLAIVLGGVCIAEALATLLVTRPPDLPAQARTTASAASVTGAAFVDWRWAGDIQRQTHRTVFASGGLASESPEFWADYVRIAQGHERWADILRERNVGLVVLDSNDQEHAAAELIRTSAEWHVTFDNSGTLVAERTSP